MDQLPKHIADIVGIRLDGPTVAQERVAMSPGLRVMEEGDGVSTVKYGDLTIGWVNEVKVDQRGGRFRALTPGGTVAHFYSLTTAKAWLMGEAV